MHNLEQDLGTSFIPVQNGQCWTHMHAQILATYFPLLNMMKIVKIICI
jgi:hypothetical protein